MMLADGKIEDEEKDIMKGIFKYAEISELSDHDIDEEINSCKENPIDLEEYLNELLPQLNKYGREKIISAAYWVSIADGEFDKAEEKLLTKLAKYFQISGTRLKEIMAEGDEIMADDDDDDDWEDEQSNPDSPPN